MHENRDALTRFCNNPTCDLCDVIVRPHEIVNRAGQEICRQCFEPLIITRVRRRPPLLPAGSHQPSSLSKSCSSKEA